MGTGVCGWGWEDGEDHACFCVGPFYWFLITGERHCLLSGWTVFGAGSEGIARTEETTGIICAARRRGTVGIWLLFRCSHQGLLPSLGVFIRGTISVDARDCEGVLVNSQIPLFRIKIANMTKVITLHRQFPVFACIWLLYRHHFLRVQWYAFPSLPHPYSTSADSFRSPPISGAY